MVCHALLGHHVAQPPPVKSYPGKGECRRSGLESASDCQSGVQFVSARKAWDFMKSTNSKSECILPLYYNSISREAIPRHDGGGQSPSHTPQMVSKGEKSRHISMFFSLGSFIPRLFRHLSLFL